MIREGAEAFEVLLGSGRDLLDAADVGDGGLGLGYARLRLRQLLIHPGG